MCIVTVFCPCTSSFFDVHWMNLLFFFFPNCHLPDCLVHSVSSSKKHTRTCVTVSLSLFSKNFYLFQCNNHVQTTSSSSLVLCVFPSLGASVTPCYQLWKERERGWWWDSRKESYYFLNDSKRQRERIFILVLFCRYTFNLLSTVLCSVPLVVFDTCNQRLHPDWIYYSSFLSLILFHFLTFLPRTELLLTQKKLHRYIIHILWLRFREGKK